VAASDAFFLSLLEKLSIFEKKCLKVWQYQEYCLLLWSELEQTEKNGCDEDSNE
jgi:hypothetical protein